MNAIAYYGLAYQIKRENFLPVFSFFTLLFAVYFIVYRFFSITHFTYLLMAGILFRLLLLFSIPNLSDDVYRFIWDGRLAANGINPYSKLPAEIIQMPPVTGITNELYRQLNSPQYYTIYPPVLQGIFWVAAKLFPVNVSAAIVFLKSIIVMVELGNVFLLIRILKKISLPKHLCLLYLLNPLVITELTGNVHFEGVMIFFVLLAFLFFLTNRWQSSAICLGLGIATKLVPILFIPLMINTVGWKKGFLYALISGLTALILFAFLFDITTILHLLKSVDLFLRRFEFNASIYYFVRWAGRLLTGYNIIAFSGPLLSVTATVLIFYLSFRHKDISLQTILVKALYIISIWFLFSTTVHPWYICLPVALAVFTLYRYAMIWSFTAILSYAAYQSHPVQENVWLTGAGYIFLAGFTWWELRNKKQPRVSLSINE
jgi:hypothetical protein